MTRRAPARLSFVVPVRSDAVRLHRCLESIRHNAPAVPIEMIVADNGSADESAGVAAQAGATVLELPGLRVAEVRNRAAERATAPLVAFVDADHTLHPGWIAAALDVLSDDRIAAAGAPYSAPPHANWVQRAYDASRDKRPGRHDVDWLGSGNLVIRRDVFHAIGGFDATLETCEDVDLCNRLRASGHRLVSDDRLGSTHYGDPTSLRAVFFGELWRGRDNIRVTMRGPLTLRALPSLAIPLVNLACVGGLISGIAAAPLIGVTLPVASAGVAAALITARAIRMTASSSGSVAQVFLPNLAVAAAYELGRALALVARATHRARREAAGERAHA